MCYQSSYVDLSNSQTLEQFRKTLVNVSEGVVLVLKGPIMHVKSLLNN